MFRYTIRRILVLIPTLLAVYTVTFILMRVTPGGPWDTQERQLEVKVKEALEEKYGFNKPIYQQYWDYLAGLVTNFDLGPSLKLRGRTVNDILGDFLPVSVQLGVIAMTLGVTLGVALGIASALKQNTWLDYSAMFFAVVGVSTPTFVVGPLLIIIFAMTLHWVPTGGWGRPEHYILPALVLALEPTAQIARYTRASMLDVIRMDYVRTAKAKGLQPWTVIVVHALKNALIPIITIAGVLLAAVITGSFFVESVFGVPGIGRYFVTSVGNRDYPVLMGVTLVLAAAVAVMNLLVDLTYGLLDPRIRYD